MIDIFDASQFMFARVYGTDRYVFFQNWGRKGFDVSAEERRRLASWLGPYLTFMFVFLIVLIEIDGIIADYLGAPQLLVYAGVIGAFVFLVSIGGWVISRTVLGGRMGNEPYIPYTQRCGAEQNGRQLLKRVGSFCLIFVGVNTAVAAFVAGDQADGLLGLVILGIGIAYEVWRYRNVFPAKA